MARQVAWTPAALDDLEAAVAFLARHSPSYAATLAQSVLQKASTLDDLSARGRIVPELSDESIRELLVHRYRLIYRIESTQIIVLAVLHGARDFGAAWRNR